MKKTGLLLPLFLALAAWGQQPAGAAAAADTNSSGPVVTTPSFPVERLQTPTFADMYCAGFINKQVLPDANFIAGGLQTPNTTKFATGDIVYLAGTGYQTGAKFAIVRELRDPNRFEIFAGQHAAVAAAGQPYAEVGIVRIVDTRSKMAIAQVDFSCDTITPGDIAVPFVEKPTVSFHPPLRFDRFAPRNGKLEGRIVLAKDFDSMLGTGMKLYMNVGSNQGVKVGDYFRAVRSYSADIKDPVDSLSFKASATEDTQKRPPSIERNMMDRSKGPTIHVADLPRRAVGEIVVIGVTPTTATGMVVFSLEDIHVGDDVEIDEQQQQAQLQPQQ